MNLSEIAIDNLFGQYDHRVQLCSEEGITIIYGLNGVGKTTLLRLTKEALGSEVTELIKTPFDRLELSFDNGSVMEVTKNPKILEDILSEDSTIDNGEKELNNEELQAKSKDLKVKDENEEPKIYYYLKNSKGEILENYSRTLKPSRRIRPIDIDDKLHFLRRVIRGVWRDTRDGQIYSLDDIEENFGHLMNPPNLPSWLEHIHNSFHVHFIGANRLHGVGRVLNDYIDDLKGVLTPAVLINSQELKREIEKKLAEFARVSQELERTFPNRLINRMLSFNEEAVPSEIEIIDRLSKLEERRTSLAKVSLLDSARDTPMNVPLGQTIDPKRKLDVHTRNVLELYIEDTEGKLQELVGMESRLNLFVNILNKRLVSTKKKVYVDKEKGYCIILPNGEEIPLEKLSSGEQHEIVLLYDLLFRTTTGSLLVIDEPELSLHITWQQKFLEDVLEIAKLTGLKMLIATHSPDIISTRWDLTVPLGEEL
jgi:predicted ATP-binding protein involved in virulence